MPKTFVIVIAIVITILILFALGRQIVDALEAGNRLDAAIEEVNKLQATNRDLKEDLSKVNTYDYIEKIARNKLNFSKPDETIVVVPPEMISKVLSASIKVEEPKLPNWQGWWNLFFKP